MRRHDSSIPHLQPSATRCRRAGPTSKRRPRAWPAPTSRCSRGSPPAASAWTSRRRSRTVPMHRASAIVFIADRTQGLRICSSFRKIICFFLREEIFPSPDSFFFANSPERTVAVCLSRMRVAGGPFLLSTLIRAPALGSFGNLIVLTVRWSGPDVRECIA